MEIDFSDLRNTYNELTDDVESSKQLDADTHSEPFIYRTYVRSFFSLVEGMISQLKGIAHQAHLQSGIFDAFEAEVLVERESFLSDKGHPKFKKKKLKFLDNLQFAVWAINKALDMKFELDKNCGWQALLRAIKIRDRITHPKGVDCLSITRDEMLKTVGPAHEWFRDSMVGLLDEIYKHIDPRDLNTPDVG